MMNDAHVDPLPSMKSERKKMLDEQDGGGARPSSRTSSRVPDMERYKKEWADSRRSRNFINEQDSMLRASGYKYDRGENMWKKYDRDRQVQFFVPLVDGRVIERRRNETGGRSPIEVGHVLSSKPGDYWMRKN